ncbi:MAG: thioredoxin [Alphaproteobacteria bacterium]|nr:thioredoxin [Alphaproteobacteria bacterium]
METLLSTGATPPAVAVIKDSDTEHFMEDVIDASREVPIIVDFWAPWCGPCKALSPALEKVVQGAKGKVRMVKVDIDQNQELAAQLRIQSIPTIYAFRDGSPVDGFQGALPESQVKSWVDQLMKKFGGAEATDPLEEAIEAAAEALEAGDYGGAGALYAQVLNQDPNHARALAGLARCYLAAGRPEKAREAIARATPEAQASAEVKAVLAGLELAEKGREAAGRTGELQARLAVDPKDHQARFELAEALFGAGQAREAIDELLTIVRRDRKWNDDAARVQLVKIFEALGPTDPLTAESRKRLSSILFS